MSTASPGHDKLLWEWVKELEESNDFTSAFVQLAHEDKQIQAVTYEMPV